MHAIGVPKISIIEHFRQKLSREVISRFSSFKKLDPLGQEWATPVRGAGVFSHLFSIPNKQR
jgi:hypothetical protein